MGATTWLTMIRHALPAERFARTHYGDADVPLGPDGLAAGEEVAARLAGRELDAVYASDLQRTTALARLLAAPRGLEVRQRRALRERNLGDFQGLTYAELDERHPRDARAMREDRVGYRAPSGENFVDLEQRVLPALDEIRQRHAGQRVLVVGHASPMRVILAHALGLPLANVFRIHVDYCGVFDVEYRPGGPRVRRMNA